MGPAEPGLSHNLPIHRTMADKTANRSASKSRKRSRNHSLKKMRRGM